MSGKGHFNVTAQYRKDGDHPTTLHGQLHFRSRETGLDLRTDDLAWLVVTPDGKAAIAGTVTIREVAYRFVAYGYEDPDRFRLVVWSTAAGPAPTGLLLYDSRPGVSFDPRRG